MGNSVGGLGDYWRVIRRHDKLLGGHIWDWIDQGLRKADGRGGWFWAYGGDFGSRENHDANFNINGIINPDRSLKPAAAEAKHVFQPLEIAQPRPGEDFFTIRNRNFFVSTDEYVFEWHITSSMGATLGSGTFEVPRTEAGACTECRVGYKAPRPESGVDYWLDIVYRLKEDKPYALRGFEAGRYQFALPAAAPVRAAAARSAGVSRTERAVTLTAGNVTATVDAATGYLSGYAVRGRELMRSSLVPNFWRASTDNDRRGWRTRERMGAWRTMPERLKLESLNAADGAVTAVVCGGGVRLALRYRLAADGELAVSYDLRIADTLPEPLRIGLQALWSGELDRYVYCGRGPGENYADRKEGRLPVRGLLRQYGRFQSRLYLSAGVRQPLRRPLSPACGQRRRSRFRRPAASVRLGLALHAGGAGCGGAYARDRAAGRRMAGECRLCAGRRGRHRLVEREIASFGGVPALGEALRI